MIRIKKTDVAIERLNFSDFEWQLVNDRLSVKPVRISKVEEKKVALPNHTSKAEE